MLEKLGLGEFSWPFKLTVTSPTSNFLTTPPRVAPLIHSPSENIRGWRIFSFLIILQMRKLMAKEVKVLT